MAGIAGVLLLAEAAARIADARANRTTQRASLGPLLDADISGSRGRSALLQPVTTESSASLNPSWELDLFGANRAAASAAQALLESSQARWHDARILVAAEIATTYTDLRVCEALIDQSELEVKSYEQTAQIVDLLARAGFETHAATDQARANAAQSRSRLIEQRAGCDLLIESLVSLTEEEENLLRRELSANAAHARYQASTVIYAARLREAIREVESALVHRCLDRSVSGGRRRLVARGAAPAH